MNRVSDRGSTPRRSTISTHATLLESKVAFFNLYQIDEDIKFNEDYINHPNSAFEKGMEFRAKRDLRLKLIDVINE